MDSGVFGTVACQPEFTLSASRPSAEQPAAPHTGSELIGVNHGRVSAEEHLQRSLRGVLLLTHFPMSVQPLIG